MSVCRFYSKKLVLLVYDELDDVERADVEAHVRACPACRKELANLRNLRSTVPPIKVGDDILQSTQRALFYKLRRASARRRETSLWTFGKPALQAGLAMALVFFGFNLGQQKTSAPQFAVQDLLAVSRTISVQDGSISPQLVSIDKIRLAPDGTVEIAYNTMNSVSIQGNAENPAVQQMLYYALLTDDDPIVRQRAVKTMRQLVKSGMRLEPFYFEALQLILDEEEHNLDITLTIIDILGRSKQPQAHDLLADVMLMNDNEAARIHAFNALTQKQIIFDRHDLLSTTKMDSNIYIRTKSLELLQQYKGTSL